MVKQRSNFNLLILLVAVLILAVLVVFWHPGPQVPAAVKNIPDTFAKSIQTTPETKKTEILSPDGKSTLIPIRTGDNISFSISGKVLYHKTLGKGDEISVPFNTFSPDNKYIFLKESSPSATGYFSLSVKNPVRIDFTNLFADKYPEYKVTEATGWGGINLIVINTNKSDGGLGPSFWYDVASNSFIRLNDRFN